MATTIEELRNKLNTSTYTPKTDEQIQQEAQNRYKGTYDQNRLNVQQNYDTTAQALKNQLDTLGTAYARQEQQARENTAAAISAADRRSIGRGMQRSSYNAATLANMQNQGNETLADIAADRTAAENAIAAQQTLAAQQLQQQLAQLDSGYASDVQAAIDALKEQEYARKTEADQYTNALLMQLYEMQEASKANDLALQMQQEQLDAIRRENAAATSGGASGGGSSSGPSGSSNNRNSAVQNVQLPQVDGNAMALLNSITGLTGNQTNPLSSVLSNLGNAISQAASPLTSAAKTAASKVKKNNMDVEDQRRSKKRNSEYYR